VDINRPWNLAKNHDGARQHKAVMFNVGSKSSCNHAENHLLVMLAAA
jgi:hypothetical protein